MRGDCSKVITTRKDIFTQIINTLFISRQITVRKNLTVDTYTTRFIMGSRQRSITWVVKRKEFGDTRQSRDMSILEIRQPRNRLSNFPS